MYKNYVELRDKKGVTDYQVSKDTGITKSTFSDWKAGRSKPKADKLKLLAEYFGVDIGYFLEEWKARKGEKWNRKKQKGYWFSISDASLRTKDLNSVR